MHVCTYARMHVCTYARMHVCTYARMHVCSVHVRIIQVTAFTVPVRAIPTGSVCHVQRGVVWLFIGCRL